MLVELYHLDLDIMMRMNHFPKYFVENAFQRKKLRDFYGYFLYIQARSLERDFLLWSCPETFLFFN